MIIELLSFPFVQRALLLGILLAVVFALLWNLVLVRHDANVVHSLSHMWLLWIALWLFIWLPTYPVMLLVIVLGGIVLHFLRDKGVLSWDATNEIVAQFGLVGALIIFAYISWYIGSIEQYLFGDILLISRMDAWVSVSLSVVVLVVTSLLFIKLFAVSFQPSLAKVYSWSKNLLNMLYSVLLAIAVWVSINVLGVLLITAFLVIGPNSAKLFVRTKRCMIVRSIVLNIIGVVWWLLSSYLLDLPSGVSIVWILLAMFLVLFVMTRIRK